MLHFFLVIHSKQCRPQKANFEVYYSQSVPKNERQPISVHEINGTRSKYEEISSYKILARTHHGRPTALTGGDYIKLAYCRIQ
jgi:hypothetical protein